MRCRAIASFTTVHGDIPVGAIVNIPEHLLIKLSGKVVPDCEEMPPVLSPVVWPPTPQATPANGGKDLPHYCSSGDCWCSQKLPAANYPNGCGKCEHFGKAPGAEREE